MRLLTLLNTAGSIVLSWTNSAIAAVVFWFLPLSGAQQLQSCRS
ncbi:MULTISPECIES: hypothetical protein [Chroococcidiopsis]|nr:MULTISPECIES: hypothetical protein [Chroococcidiopsis]